jgi:hypothetical protein
MQNRKEGLAEGNQTIEKTPKPAKLRGDPSLDNQIGNSKNIGP